MAIEQIVPVAANSLMFLILSSRRGDIALTEVLLPVVMISKLVPVVGHKLLLDRTKKQNTLVNIEEFWVVRLTTWVMFAESCII